MIELKYIYIFNGLNSNFPSAVFSDIDITIKWIYIKKLSGVLTEYPLDISVYDWAISNGYFIPSSDKKKTPKFISNFSSAHLSHYHFF